jgi:hypothetical protein
VGPASPRFPSTEHFISHGVHSSLKAFFESVNGSIDISCIESHLLKGSLSPHVRESVKVLIM